MMVVNILIQKEFKIFEVRVLAAIAIIMHLVMMLHGRPTQKGVPYDSLRVPWWLISIFESTNTFLKK